MSEDISSPLPVEPIEADSSAAIPVAESIHFCGKCGAQWESDWTECHRCADRRSAVASSQVDSQRRSLIKTFVLYGCLLGTSLGFSIAAAINGQHGLRILVPETVVFILITSIFVALSWRAIWPLLRRTGPVRWVLLAPLIGIGTFLIANTLVAVLHRVFHVESTTFLDDFQEAGYGMGLAILMVAVQPAIFEELAFRGVILDALIDVTGANEAILASGAMFAILHLSIVSFPHLFALGIVLAWLRNKSGSLYAGMIVHFTHNALCLVFEHLQGGWSW